ncbi:MAG: hypothetical protein ACOCXA_01915, partial [Planctomycetota bacterium]
HLKQQPMLPRRHRIQQRHHLGRRIPARRLQTTSLRAQIPQIVDRPWLVNGIQRDHYLIQEWLAYF